MYVTWSPQYAYLLTTQEKAATTLQTISGIVHCANLISNRILKLLIEHTLNI